MRLSAKPWTIGYLYLEHGTRRMSGGRDMIFGFAQLE